MKGEHRADMGEMKKKKPQNILKSHPKWKPFVQSCQKKVVVKQRAKMVLTLTPKAPQSAYSGDLKCTGDNKKQIRAGWELLKLGGSLGNELNSSRTFAFGSTV